MNSLKKTGFLSFLGSFFSRYRFPVQAKSLIVGLGNPGEKYSNTRHNIGFRVADAFCESFGQKRVGHALSADYCISDNNEIIVAKPTIFMNRSGDTVNALIKKLKVPISSLIILVDDFNIPLGTIRIRPGGSDGGHNGLKSVSSYLGTGFPRLRIGIGPLPKGVDVISFVLGDFSEKEQEHLNEVIQRAVSALKVFLTEGVAIAMNKFNR